MSSPWYLTDNDFSDRCQTRYGESKFNFILHYCIVTIILESSCLFSLNTDVNLWQRSRFARGITQLNMENPLGPRQNFATNEI